MQPSDRTNNYDLTVSGGIAFIDKSFYPTRPIRDSFALVKVGDLEGVTVSYSNNEVGTTDKKGELIIPNLNSYYYNDISIEKGILSYARDINADLIALNTHGRSGLSQLFNGSIGQELANHALRPVVTFKI